MFRMAHNYFFLNKVVCSMHTMNSTAHAWPTKFAKFVNAKHTAWNIISFIIISPKFSLKLFKSLPD